MTGGKRHYPAAQDGGTDVTAGTPASSASQERYHRPPDDYSPPTKCKACKGLIAFGPVEAGERWHHLTEPDDGHEVVMPKQWWDVRTGRWRRGVWGIKP